MPERLLRYYYLRVLRVFRRVARGDGTARSIAVGAAIGMVVAMTPTVGMQMAIATTICLCVRANPLPAVPIVWITNPVTIIPIYTFNYWVGTLLVRSGPRLEEFRRSMEHVIHTLETSGTRAAMGELGNMGWRMQLPLWAGCFAVGGVLAVPTYFVFLRSVTRLRERLARRRAARQARLRDIIPERAASPPSAAAACVRPDAFPGDAAGGDAAGGHGTDAMEGGE